MPVFVLSLNGRLDPLKTTSIGAAAVASHQCRRHALAIAIFMVQILALFGKLAPCVCTKRIQKKKQTTNEKTANVILS